MSIVASRGVDQFSIRFPDGMRDEIKAAAKRNGKSMNSEIIDRIGIIGSGKTLRDEFAMAALTGMLGAGDYAYDHDAAARDAYTHADAMLVARHKISLTEIVARGIELATQELDRMAESQKVGA